MRKLLSAAAIGAFLAALSSAPGALAHLPVVVEVVEPRPGAVVDGPEVRLVLKASNDGLSQQVALDVLVDGKYVDPATGELSDERPSFGGPTIETGETVTLVVRDLSEGAHRLEVVVPSHHGETPIEIRFSVGRRPLWGIPAGLAIGIVLVLGAAGLGLANRRRA